jgi:hypothetical protein
VIYPDRNMRANTNRPYGFLAKMNGLFKQSQSLVVNPTIEAKPGGKAAMVW